jgi:hypothetical protein
VKKETIKSPKPRTARSPNRSTNLPEINPEEKRMIAKLEMIKPIAVLLTPKDEAKIGIAGIIKPKPTATKNATADKTETSRGSWAKGFLLNLLFFI